MAETLSLTPHETVTIRKSTAELLEVEGELGTRREAASVPLSPLPG